MYCKFSAVSSNVLDVICILVSEIMVIYICILVLPLMTCCLGVVLSNRPCDMSALEPCNHSEADTMIFRHIAHASGQGHQTAYMLEQLIVIS